MQPQLRKIRLGESRLFEPMYKLISISDSVGISTMYALTGSVGPIEETPRNATAALCIQFPTIVVRFPVLTLLKAAVHGKPLTEFSMGVVERKPPPPLPPGKVQSTVPKHGEFALSLMTPIYVDFYERHRAWIKSTFGGDSYTWPPLFNFARVVRNCISHHSGQLHFENQGARPVSWHSLSYSPANNGRKVLADDIDVGDLIILMFEISDELDNAGCPLNP